MIMRFRRGSAVLSIFFIAALPCILAGAAACAARPDPRTSSQQDRIFLARDRVLPALVHIQPVLEIFESGEKGKLAVTGSGVIFSDAGYILTNTHVVGGAQRLTCTLFNQEEVEARLIGIDPLSDLAVIKIEMGEAGAGVRHATLGDSSSLEVGQMVVAMGTPLGLARSLTLGVISSLDRYFPESLLPSGTLTGTYNTWIQTDAAINPGNSGGPLVDLDGKVIGINARAITMVGENLGFAIPINLAKEIAAQLIQKGQIARSWIGVSCQQMKGLAEHFGVPEDSGALIGSVVPGSPAADAGLQAGDIIVAVGGKRTETSRDVRDELGRVDTGQVEITVNRDGKEQVMTAELTRPRRTSMSRFHGQSAPMFNIPDVGFDEQALQEEMDQLRKEMEDLRRELSDLRDDSK